VSYLELDVVVSLVVKTREKNGVDREKGIDLNNKVPLVNRAASCEYSWLSCVETLAPLGETMN